MILNTAQSIPAAHSGFLKRARSTNVEQLYELAALSGRKLVLCGHSLGQCAMGWVERMDRALLDGKDGAARLAPCRRYIGCQSVNGGSGVSFYLC